jgi:tetratricopeptide (TPR) repeat protein
MRWFEIERANIVVLVERAAVIGEVAACWNLACTTSQLFAVSQYTDEWSALILRALSAAQQAGDVLGQGRRPSPPGLLKAHGQDFLAAKREFERSTALFGVVENARGIGLALAYTGAVERFAQRPEAAIGYYRRAITTLRPTGDVGGEAFAFRGMGQAEMDRAHYAAAASSFEQALNLYRSLPGAHVSVAQVNFCRGLLFTRQSRFAEAEALFAEVGATSQQVDDPSGQAQALRGLALCQHERDDKEAAAGSLEAALRLVKPATFLEGIIQATIDDLGYRGMLAIDPQ